MKLRVYVARDSQKTLGNDMYLFLAKPVKSNRYWQCTDGTIIPISEDLLPEGVNPQWEDEEPIELEMELKMPKQIEL